MDQELTFRDLGLSEEILKALEKKGYGYPTRVQAEAITITAKISAWTRCTPSSWTRPTACWTWAFSRM